MADGEKDRRMIGALLRIPREAALRQVVAGLEAAGFSDVRPAHFTVFQHLPLVSLRLTALAEAALLTKQTMGYLVDDLEALGYVERIPDPADRRAKLIRLTPRGRQVDETVRAVIQRLEEEWAARMGEENYQTLQRLLRDLIAILEEAPRHSDS
jgi:DNA-binding MarR family transcriptional regulator